MSIEPEPADLHWYDAEVTQARELAWPEDVREVNGLIAETFTLARLHDRLGDWVVAGRSQSSGHEELELIAPVRGGQLAQTVKVERALQAVALDKGPTVTAFVEDTLVEEGQWVAAETTYRYNLVPSAPTYVTASRVVTPFREIAFRPPDPIGPGVAETALLLEESDKLRTLFASLVDELHAKHPERLPGFAAERMLADLEKAQRQQANRSPLTRLFRRIIAKL